MFEERKMPAKLPLFNSISPIPFQNDIESMKCRASFGDTQNRSPCPCDGQ